MNIYTLYFDKKRGGVKNIIMYLFEKIGGTERGEPMVFAKDLGTRVGPDREVGRGEWFREEGRGEGVGDTPSSLPGDAESGN